MKHPYRILELAKNDDNPELVLELLKTLCRDLGMETMSVVSPTAPPAKTGHSQDPVDKSGVPTTTTVDTDMTDAGGAP